MKKKICVFTGSRAEYGLLKPLIDQFKNEKSVRLQMLVTGMHLSPEFDLTYRTIEEDGNKIDEKIEILLSSDTPVGTAKAMGLGLISFSEAFQRLRPDLLIGLGDRFELFAVVSAALVSRIPVAHIHGGELTFGAYDEGFRHAITKMSHLHFTSTEIYRKRVIQLGENPANVFNVGAIGIDNIKNTRLLSLSELQNSISFSLDRPFFIVTFHPETLDNKQSGQTFSDLLKSLDQFPDYKVIFTKPNADSGGRVIIKMIEGYISQNRPRCITVTSLGQQRYLSTIKFAELMIGNSSSGIIEMPYFKKPTINIGDRQKGRVMPVSVIQADGKQKSIIQAINKGLSTDFSSRLPKVEYIYGSGRSADKISKIILKTDISKLIKKEFYDLQINEK